MALWDLIKAQIDSVLIDNITGEISPADHRQLEKDIIDAVGSSQFKGVAIPTSVPFSADGPIFYFASTNGTYTNFAGLSLTNELVVLSNSTGSWLKTQILDLTNLGGGGSDTAEQIRDKLESLSDADRLDASAIQNLPSGGAGSSNYPFANEVAFTGYTWIKDYILDVKIIEEEAGSLYKTDGNVKKMRFTYLDATRIWIEAENNAGDDFDLVAYIINGSGFGSNIAWVEVPEQSNSGISASVRINPTARDTSTMTNVQDLSVSQIEPFIIKRGSIPVIPPNGNPNYPFQPDATLAVNSGYIKDIKLIFDDPSKRFRPNGEIRKFWIGYFGIAGGTARLFLYGENDAGDGSQLFGFILEASFVNPGDIWFWQAVPDPSTTGVRALVYLNWNNASGGSAEESYAITGIDPYIVRLGATTTAGTDHIFQRNHRASSTDTNGIEVIKDIRVIGKEDQNKEIAITWMAKNDPVLGNAIGFQIRHKNTWRKYCVFTSLVDPGNSTTWIECDYDDIPAGETDHFSDTLKIKFKIAFSELADGITYLWGASNYTQEPNYILSNRIFEDDEYSGLAFFLQYWEQGGNSDYGDFNELLSSKDVNLIVDNANRLPAGTTRPAGVEVGMVWLDTSASATDPQIKIRLS